MTRIPESQSVSKTSQESVQTDTASLQKLISIPHIPISVKWQVDESNGSSQLFVLLKFSDSDYKDITQSSPGFEIDGNAILSSASFHAWVPESIKAQLSIKARPASVEIIGVSPLTPTLFTQAKHSPFINGQILPLGSNVILVILKAS